MSDRPKLAVVSVMREHNLRDIPSMLRQIADEIEHGSYGSPEKAAIVLQGKHTDLFAIGDCDISGAHLLFSLGCRKIENIHLGDAQ